MFDFVNLRPSSCTARRAERGAGTFKAILATVIIAAGVYAGFKIIPAYVNDYQLKDKMQEIARFSVVNRYNEEQVRDQVFKEIDELRIPVKREEIKVAASPKRVTIAVNYTIPVDLTFYQTDLHFADSAENSALF